MKLPYTLPDLRHDLAQNSFNPKYKLLGHLEDDGEWVIYLSEELGDGYKSVWLKNNSEVAEFSEITHSLNENSTFVVDSHHKRYGPRFGVNVVAKLKKQNPQAYVAVLTNYTGFRTDFESLNCDNFFDKNNSLPEVSKKIKVTSERKRDEYKLYRMEALMNEITDDYNLKASQIDKLKRKIREENPDFQMFDALRSDSDYLEKFNKKYVAILDGQILLQQEGGINEFYDELRRICPNRKPFIGLIHPLKQDDQLLSIEEESRQIEII